jgi:hypothetical protein
MIESGDRAWAELSDGINSFSTQGLGRMVPAILWPGAAGGERALSNCFQLCRKVTKRRPIDFQLWAKDLVPRVNAGRRGRIEF